MLMLQKLMAVKGIQQVELANKLGVSKQLVNTWLKKKQPITKKLVKPIEDIFNKDIEFLTTEVSDWLQYDIEKQSINILEFGKKLNSFRAELKDVKEQVNIKLDTLGRELDNFTSFIESLHLEDELEN